MRSAMAMTLSFSPCVSVLRCGMGPPVAGGQCALVIGRKTARWNLHGWRSFESRGAIMVSALPPPGWSNCVAEESGLFGPDSAGVVIGLPCIGPPTPVASIEPALRARSTRWQEREAPSCRRRREEACLRAASSVDYAGRISTAESPGRGGCMNSGRS